ncbi:unnamed protein product [Thelazia callipaeda]|uniref:Uncharacterized protein n=1 Tax=Thelazia callipaeda TaxID=103827 RepID=A0A0N5CSY0_THECL|nr:unnamed protein product [Thelazia callipaeda]
MRQNSASNLDPYRRPPLPSMNPSQINEPLREAESSSLNALVEKLENTSMLKNGHDLNDPKLFGINITSIRGLQAVPLENERRRPLPIPSDNTFNHLS